MRWARAIPLFVAGLSCGGGASSTLAHAGSGDGGGGASIAVGGADSGPPLPVASDAGTETPCRDLGRSIFAVASDGRMLALEPERASVRTLGTLACSRAMPFAMTVDRTAHAWVFYLGGEVFKVDLATLACTKTAYGADTLGWSTLSMAFVTDPRSPRGESLYATGLSFVAGFKPAGLARVDPDTMRFDYLAAFAAGGEPGDLTGTGDGRLFAFVNARPPKLIEYDRTSAATITSTPLPGLTIGSGWAFAHWGGGLYLFTAPGRSSRVDRYDLASGTLTPVLAEVGAIVVGAGVSTCAPTERIR